MAKLIFTYAVMNSGKSTALLQANYNYTSENKNTILISHKIDNRFGESVIASRLGYQAPCFAIDNKTNIFNYVKKQLESLEKVSCIFADEVQFFTKKQVIQLSNIVDELNIPVMAYGLKNNFKGDLFEGTATMLAYANEIRSLKQACFCEKEANMILRYEPDGKIIKEGEGIKVGAESMYRSVCRKHWKEGNLGPSIYKKLGVPDPFNK